MTKAYQIESKAGIVLGTYDGADEYEAYEALCNDAGHHTADDVPDEVGTMDDLTFTEVDTDTESKTYYVRIGGSPPESAEEYDTAEAAVEGAMEMARGIADREGIDPDDLEEWGSEADIGAGGWGVCPDGDSGAYWPYIYADCTGCRWLDDGVCCVEGNAGNNGADAGKFRCSEYADTDKD